MFQLRLHALRPLLCGLLAGLALVGPAHATWSIIAIDPVTGQIGIAGASCTPNVQGIGEIVPGVGVIVVQAHSNGAARIHGVRMLKRGASPAEIIAELRAENFDPENQQYGVVVMLPDQPPATYSGKSISDWSGSLIADNVAIQGNILVSDKVLADAMAAFQAAADQTLAERLTAALVAGGAAGGDRRCGDQHATSAFVTVFNPEDEQAAPYLHMVVHGIEKGGPAAVQLLGAQFERWRVEGMGRKSTRLYLVP